MNNFTTNEEDQREAKRLQDRLRRAYLGLDDQDEPAAAPTTTTTPAPSFKKIPNVSIAEGPHKYVLISALLPDNSERQHFVVSKKHAQYHRNAAEPFVEKLERARYRGISVLGGGRINLNTEMKTMSIYGYSYGFGLADHALSKSVVEKDPRYEGFEITWSNEGY